MKIVDLSKAIYNLSKLLTNTSISTNYGLRAPMCNVTSSRQNQQSLFSTTTRCNAAVQEKQAEEKNKSQPVNSPKGLMEFFDDPNNWGAEKIKVGRAWKKDELRLKSNEDLHKLWFVLLKERNMLKTMEQACNEEAHLFPNPERIDKVEISMENLEHVVRERNRAYHLLETGEHGERPTKVVSGLLGLRYLHRMRQYFIPRFMNTTFNKNNKFHYGGFAVRKFRRRFYEKLLIEKCKERSKTRSTIAYYFRNYPNVDIEAIHAQHPEIPLEDIKKMKDAKKNQPHAEPK